MAPEKRLVIFDCDGVLVDSEPISIEVLVASFARAGVLIDEAGAYRRFLGRSLSTVIAAAREEFGLDMDEAFLERLRQDLFARFRADLRPIPGVIGALEALQAHGIDWCVASSSHMERIRLSLTVTGLIDRFDPNIFSAAMVARGKPAPDLFLHAAERMGRTPSACIVIEDSPAGIEAAKAAGMTVFAFTGGSHTHFASHRAALDALAPDAVFDAMADLIHLVAKE
ncbi:MAG TPA: HAD family phosphatase [Rhizobium sp.]|nr:HAD family phosphatase [Rhizobium sp.]